MILFLFCSLGEAEVQEKKEAVIGVLAFRSKPDTLREWTPLARYLDSKVSHYRFTIRPLSYAEFNAAAERNELDFAFTNPEHYIYLSAKYGISRMATLIRANVEGKPLTEFGGVIFTRSDNLSIKGINDITGKKIAAVDELSLGGYLAQRTVLQKNGIDISDRKRVVFTDMPHDKVVYLVESGTADVGFVRTGVLEKMAREGKIDLKEFRILNSMGERFPLFLSTELYPEWPFAASKKVDRELANQVGVALLNLPYGENVAKSGGYYGWNIPLTYEGIRALMQKLRIKPYDTTPAFSFVDVLQRYVFYIIVILTGVIGMLVYLLFRLNLLTRSLKSKSHSLEMQIEIVRDNANQLRRAARVFDNTQEGIIITDPKRVITDVNEAFCALTGYRREEVIGQKPLILRSGNHNKEFYEELDRTILEHGSWKGEIWNKKKNGELYAQFLRVDTVKDENGQIENYIGIFSDITELKKEKDELIHMANYDSLTNLPNRYLYMTFAAQTVALMKRKGAKAVIAFLDLDDFKQINDKYGHETGDRLLKKVAMRLEKQMRQSDIIARIGGDEFVVLLSDIQYIEDAKPMLERLLASLSDPFVFEGFSFLIGASIGVAIYPDDSEDIDMLVRYADSAMYRSKESGKNRITYYTKIGEQGRSNML